MIREITEPTEALDTLVQESVKPMFFLLASILTELLGGEPTRQQILLCSASIIGQCMHFQIAREVFKRLNPDMGYDEAAIEMMAHHVTQFSLAGIRAMRSSNGSKA
jgi:hypothetical protein